MLIALGYIAVATPGVLVIATNNIVDTNASQPFTKNNWPAHGVLFQAAPGNVGKTYILSAGGNRSTGAGLLAALAIPTANSIPSASFTITIAGAALELQDLWIDADQAGDKVLVTALVI